MSEREVEPAVAVADEQIDLRESRRHQRAVVGRGAIADAVEAQPRPTDARRPHRVPPRQARPPTSAAAPAPGRRRSPSSTLNCDLVKVTSRSAASHGVSS